MRYLIISTSRDPDSRSRVLCGSIEARLSRQDDVITLDAGALDLPFCDNDGAWSHPGTLALQEAIEQADGVVIGMGVYNYAPAAAAKTVVELGNQAWHGRVVAIAATAGGSGSLLAMAQLAISLMLDFQCIIVPRFVYATAAAYEGESLIDDRVHTRIDAQVGELRRMTEALSRP